jgi:hypothetical protein
MTDSWDESLGNRYPEGVDCGTPAADWVVCATFDINPTAAAMDRWERALQRLGLDGLFARIPQRHQTIATLYLPGADMDMVNAMCEGHDTLSEIVGQSPVGIETITEDEHQHRAEEPTLPELMSAMEIAEVLKVSRQRVHQLRSTPNFPAPLAEPRCGAVWDAAAVRAFARQWRRKPGRPRRIEADQVVVSTEGATADQRSVTAHHEAGHAVAVVMRGGGELKSITIDATDTYLGYTGYRGKPSDTAFIAFAGPWAEARYQWPLPSREGEDGDGLTFDDHVVAAFLCNTDDSNAHRKAVKADKALIGPEFAHLVDNREAVWSDELERSWPAICELAEMLIAGQAVTDAHVRATLAAIECD